MEEKDKLKELSHDKVEHDIDEHDQDEKDEADREQCIAMEAPVWCVGHLADNRRCQETHGAEDVRHIGHVACDHDDCHCLAEGATDALYDSCGDATSSGKERNPEIGFRPRRPQGKRPLLVFLGHRVECRRGNIDDVREDHDREYDDGGEQGGARAEAEGVLNGGNENDHTHQAVDDRGDAGKQFH